MVRIFEHFSDLQSRNQAGRHRILQLLNELLDHYRKSILPKQSLSLVAYFCSYTRDEG